MAKSSKLKITQVKGLVGADHKQKNSMRTLGLKKIRQEVTRDDTPQVRGLIAKVRHLVEVEEI